MNFRSRTLLPLLFSCVQFVAAQYARPDQAPIGVEISDNANATMLFSRTYCNRNGEQIHYGGAFSFKESCPSLGTWIRGMDSKQAPPIPSALICSRSPLLQLASRYATVTIGAGDTFQGGNFIERDTNRPGFDAIVNIKKIPRVSESPDVKFEITVARIYCPGYGGLGEGGVGPYGPQIAPPPPGFGGTGGAGVGGAGGPACFHGDTVVYTRSGAKLMSELKVGEEVLSTSRAMGLRYSKVTSFLHHLPDAHVKFLRIETTSGKNVTLTPLHMIYVRRCDANDAIRPALKFARHVKPGTDCLVQVQGPQDDTILLPVQSITPIILKGAYGPMTTSTDIVVNDFAASCYAIVDDNIVVDSLLKISNRLSSLVDTVLHGLGLATTRTDNRMQMPSTLDYFLHHINHFIPVKSEL